MLGLGDKTNLPVFDNASSKMEDASSNMGDASEMRDARADLAARSLPQMKLSPFGNPLNAPFESTPPHIDPAVRSIVRFLCPGNAVITGGAGTLALASARALLEHGTAQITLLDLPATLKASEAAINELKARDPSASIYQHAVDVTSEPAVKAAFAIAHTKMGSIDMLLCFAGIVGCVHSLDVAAPAFQKVLDVNLTGSFLCAQAAARYMQQSANEAVAGSILFTASISAHATNYPQPQVAYNVSKAGVLHLTKNLAAEWAVYGIRVNCISPGYMDTILNEGENLQAVREVWASRCPMGRMGDVDEITGPVVMLMSPRAGRYITGANITVDGGAMCF